MLPQRIREGPILVCQGCGYALKAPEEYKLIWKHKQKERELRVIEGAPPTLPTTRARCPSCGHDVAYWWLRQTRGADEPSTRFYRCVKCGHTWREYA
jgi:DNA-directed RNA polymerase subunit M